MTKGGAPSTIGYNRFVTCAVRPICRDYAGWDPEIAMVLRAGRHVVPRVDGGWSVRRSGASRASRNFGSQGEAVNYARELAQREHTDLYIHRLDGTVRQRLSYSDKR